MPRTKTPKGRAVPYVPPVRAKPPRANTKYNEQDKKFCLDLVRKGWTLKQIQGTHGIPSSTIDRWVHNPGMVLGSGRHGRVLTDDEEKLIVIALEYMSASGLALKRQHVMTVVQEFVNQIGRPNPFKKGVPGYKFLRGFEQRHRKFDIRLRNPEHLSSARALSMTKENVEAFYAKLKIVLEENGITEHPEFLFNLDETNLTGAPEGDKVYVGVAQKNAYYIIPDGTKTSFTVLFCGNAAGTFLPPLTIYKSEGLWDTWMMNGVPGAAYSNSSSGWMLGHNFEGWMDKVFVPYVKRVCLGHKVVLTYDGHNSHITYNTIRMAIDNNITILCLPPHSSHALQPLDVGVFSSVKGNWRSLVSKFYNMTQLKLSKEVFPALLKDLWASLKGENLVAGFRACGLHPFNSDAVNDKIVIDASGLRANVVAGRQNLSKRASEKILIKVLEDVVSAKIDQITAIAAPAVARRKRVQAVSGEVLTSEESSERIQKEEAVKKALEDKKAQNRVLREKRAAERLLSINMKPVSKKKKDNSGKPKKGIESYLTDLGTTASANMDQVPSSSAGPSGTQDLSLLCPSDDDDDVRQVEVANQPPLTTNKRNDVRGPGFYAEDSTLDSDVDDPAYVVVKRPTAAQCRRKLKNHKTYVIYEYEGAKFPGLVTKFEKRSGMVTIKCFSTGSQLSSWKWPVDELLRTINISDIVEILEENPKLRCGRTSEYYIERMKAHGWVTC